MRSNSRFRLFGPGHDEVCDGITDSKKAVKKTGGHKNGKWINSGILDFLASAYWYCCYRNCLWHIYRWIFFDQKARSIQVKPSAKSNVSLGNCPGRNYFPFLGNLVADQRPSPDQYHLES